MILDDLFPGKLQSSSEVIENCVDTEAKWNRFGIASIKSEPEYGAARDIMSVRSRSTGRRPRVGVTISRPFRVRYRMGLIQRFSGLFSWKFSEGVGGLNLWDLRGAVTARGSRTGFFWRSRTFDYFFRNQRFQTARHWWPERKPSPRNRLAGPSPSMGAPSRPVARIIFQAVRAGGGRGYKSSAPTGGATAWPVRASLREIRESFSGPAGSRASARGNRQLCRCLPDRRAHDRRPEKSPRNSGWGGWP